jgi:hypothetical protein
MGSPSPSWILASTQDAYFCGSPSCYLETGSGFIGFSSLELAAVEAVLSENAELVEGNAPESPDGTIYVLRLAKLGEVFQVSLSPDI